MSERPGFFRILDPKADGQALVEVALILPLLLVAVVVFAQVWCLCHNACAMQEGVSRRVRQAVLSGGASSRSLIPDLGLLGELRGQTTLPVFRVEHRLIQPWRPFPGLATVKAPGYRVLINGSLVLWKGGWGLSPVRIDSTVECPMEPPVPEEQ